MSPSLLQNPHLTKKQIQTIQNPLARLTASPELKHLSTITLQDTLICHKPHLLLPERTQPPPPSRPLEVTAIDLGFLRCDLSIIS
ncbi:hypothetical protein TNCT_484621 [Trichonephila clavata]|uniref:Uncharacterized protein n=1 Tax=Trichonephila clavata TaxID=2740835 RepID=A0A8X6KN74_TRICU|nr:hypothetical protein TNCT_484621 [Trichonephila clavata]